MAKKIKYISERLSYLDKQDQLTIVIDSKQSDSKSALLFGWLACWTIIGFLMLYYLFIIDLNREDKLYISIFLIFWAYFEILVMKGFFWRKFGKELLKINKDGVQIKNDIKGYGKVRTYFLENITKPERLIHKPSSLLGFLDASYWNLGGDRLVFYQREKPIRFAKELDEHETVKILRILKSKWELFTA